MIKSTELRIGNKILKRVNGTLVEENVLPNTILEIYQIEQVGGNVGAIYKPIKLTEEWLQELGGVLQPWGWVFDNILLRSNKPINGKSFWVEIGNGVRAKVEYVHQLQNLFFSLTGKELTITTNQ